MSAAEVLPIAVVIPTKDRWSAIERLVSSLSLQRLRPQEVIVVDDGSSGVRPDLPDWVKVIRHETSQGCAKARNTGLGAAQAAWRLVLDDDTELPDRNLLGDALKLAESQPRCGLLALQQLTPSGQAHYIQPATVATTSRCGLFLGCCFMLRAAAFEQVGGFEEILNYYLDEYEYCVRLVAQGWDVIYAPHLRVVHHEDPRGRNHARIHRLLLRNAWLIALLHYPVPLVPAFSLHYLLHFVRLSRSGKRIDWGGPLWAFREILRLRPDWWGRRRPISWTASRRHRQLRHHPEPIST